MVEQISVAPSPLPPASEPTEVDVQVTYDFATGKVTYDPPQITIDGNSWISLQLSTLNSGGADARFYGFTVSPNWPGAMQMAFPSDPELRINVPFPETPGGSFLFKPTIEASGAPILRQGTLEVDVVNSALLPLSPSPGSDDGPIILVTYDAGSGAITYTPKQVVVSPSPTPTTISCTLTGAGPETSGPATFYGFAIRSGWLPQMEIGVTPSLITIVDPNTEEFPLPGTFGFVTLVQAPAGAPAVTSNPDPTIYNEPIGGTNAAPAATEQQAA